MGLLWPRGERCEPLAAAPRAGRLGLQPPHHLHRAATSRCQTVAVRSRINDSSCSRSIAWPMLFPCERSATMLMRKLGRTGLRVSALCLGGNTFGWTTDQKTSEAVLDAYVEAGGNFIDTADVYSRWAPGNKGGESETALGIWLAARKHRAS